MQNGLCSSLQGFFKDQFRAAAAEFICREKNIHVYINVKDRRAARKE